MIELAIALTLFVPEYHSAIDQEAMDVACDILPISCEGIEPPMIITTAYMNMRGYYGLYVQGEDQIFIAIDAPKETVLHETVHYVMYEAGFRFGTCASEEVARMVTARWLNRPYDDSWRARYGCLSNTRHYLDGHGTHIVMATE